MLQIIRSDLLPVYKQAQQFTLTRHLAILEKMKFNGGLYDLYFGEASVYSSQIEGSTVSESEYANHIYSGGKNRSDRIKEVEDLHKAYRFSRENKLNKTNLLKVHKIASATILKDHPERRGKIRNKNVYIKTMLGLVIYSGPSPENAQSELKKLTSDIDILLKMKLTTTEAFYYASMIHLVFVNIHPFADGNGRTGRLLEKWFLAQHIGSKAWLIRSEKYYRQRQQQYYKNLNILGEDYETINYRKSIPFLLMLPWALRLSH